MKLLGAAFFIGLMSVGYYYNLTFVQLGLFDLGERVIGMDRAAIAGYMAVLAILTCVIALIVGEWMTRRQVGLIGKLRLAFIVIVIQTILTPLAPEIRTSGWFLVWIIICSIALGIGVPATFSLAVDLVPRGWRGGTAALITSLAYLAANLIPNSWTIEEFARPLILIMPAGLTSLGLLSFFAPSSFLRKFAQQHRSIGYGKGRYVASANHRLFGLIVLMFGVFFVDSLGFLRLLETPRFMESAWQASSLDVRLTIGIVHAIAALVGGILYDALDVQELFYWIFGIFALTHLLYTFSVRTSMYSAPLIQPVLYATAVSLYTVVNFALWADLSTPLSIGRNAALGVALSGWSATFLSTALAIWWEKTGMPLERHLNIVDSLAILFFLILIIQTLKAGGQKSQGEEI